MFSAAQFTTAVDGALSQLQKAQQSLSTVRCPEIASLSINLNTLSQQTIDELLLRVPTGYGTLQKGVDYIYIIGLDTENSGLTAKLMADLTATRATGTKDYSRINAQNVDSDTLYVGRSKTLRTRLKQHLGDEGRGVYSLHLGRWATQHDVNVTISFMCFNNGENLLVQAIEDGLWNSLRPAFGRKGER